MNKLHQAKAKVGEIAISRLKSIAGKIKVRCCHNENGQKTFVRRYVSGHASKMELKELIEKINPTKIIPIHTTNPELFEGMFVGKVVLPMYAQSIEL